MSWTICLVLSVAALILALLFACKRIKYKRGRIMDPLRIMFVGVVLSTLFLFAPILMKTCENSGYVGWESIPLALHNVIKLFVVDADLKDVFDMVGGGVIGCLYRIVFSVLFLLAPALTFGFVLTFFKNVWAYVLYFLHLNTNVAVFSELNEKSLALMQSMNQNPEEKCFFVFTDVFEREEEQNFELVERVKELGAVCFKKDISAMKIFRPLKKHKLYFFAIGADQTENVNQSLRLFEAFKDRENTYLYVFSTQMEAEMLLSSAFNQDDGAAKIKVRRINEVQSLILRNLYENGYENIFQSAVDHPDGVKRINAIVVGMGQHGMEMTKALTWFSQMDGYLLEVNSFDSDRSAEDRFTGECPELMKFSGKLDIEGEARYTVHIHSGVNVDGAEFYKAVRNLPQTSYVFVALGNDEKNIATAVKLRAEFERMGHKPVIQALVCNSDKKEALSGVTNFKGQEYAIDFIGDMNSSYSREVILGSDIEEEAKKRHMLWGSEKEFWQYNYNYKSSIASAIHKKMKILCGMPGVELEPKDRAEKDLWALRVLEHRRWNAYMRSEGYVFGGTVEKSGRNDLAKMHNCLVPFAELPLKEQEKDDN